MLPLHRVSPGPPPRRDDGEKISIRKRDQRDLPAVIRFAPMGGAAIGIEARIGAGVESRTMDAKHSGRLPAPPRPSRPIATPLHRTGWREAADCQRIVIDKGGTNFLANFIR